MFLSDIRQTFWQKTGHWVHWLQSRINFRKNDILAM